MVTKWQEVSAVVQLPQAWVAAIGDGSAVPFGAAIAWPLCPIRAGTELVRDHLPGPKSVQRAAALLAVLGPSARQVQHLSELNPVQLSCF
jgi:hypothetical protein